MVKPVEGTVSWMVGQAVVGLVGVEVVLDDYGVNSVTEGIEALAAARVVVRATGALAAQGVVKSAQVRCACWPCARCCAVSHPLRGSVAARRSGTVGLAAHSSGMSSCA